MHAKPLVLLLLALTIAFDAVARQGEPSVPVDQIIQKFTARETEFKRALTGYTFRVGISVQELGSKDSVVGGEYHVVLDLLFDKKGKRTIKSEGPARSTLRRIAMSPEDLDDIQNLESFPLTTETIQKYSVQYAGEEQVNDTPCYVFDTKPKAIEKGQRYFEGKIWVEKSDLHVLKTYGKAVPDLKVNGGENLFPRFETFRSQVDSYWFPVTAQALDTLNFSTGATRIRQLVTYDNYKKP